MICRPRETDPSAAATLIRKLIQKSKPPARPRETGWAVQNNWCRDYGRI